jgi:malate dehydrogenase (oxaloacetate-decarboxylating)(NADP+)
MFLAAARTLAAEVSNADLARGSVYPSLARIRDVSLKIATAVATEAYEQGLAQTPRPDDIAADISKRMFVPDY